MVICPNGIPETFKEEPHFERNNTIPHILFLSNLIVDKGFLVLLNVLKILKERGCSFVCDFVGGETKEIDTVRFTQEVESRGLNQNVLYHGKRYGEEKVECFEKADVFVFPTFYKNECFPLVLLEAMQHKLPIVTSEEGGIPDIVDGKCGMTCSAHDANAVANNIVRLIQDKDLRTSMGEAGYQHYKQHFTMEVFEKTMVDILRSNLA